MDPHASFEYCLDPQGTPQKAKNPKPSTLHSKATRTGTEIYDWLRPHAEKIKYLFLGGWQYCI